MHRGLSQRTARRSQLERPRVSASREGDKHLDVPCCAQRTRRGQLGCERPLASADSNDVSLDPNDEIGGTNSVDELVKTAAQVSVHRFVVFSKAVGTVRRLVGLFRVDESRRDLVVELGDFDVAGLDVQILVAGEQYRRTKLVIFGGDPVVEKRELGDEGSVGGENGGKEGMAHDGCRQATSHSSVTVLVIASSGAEMDVKEKKREVYSLRSVFATRRRRRRRGRRPEDRC